MVGGQKAGVNQPRQRRRARPGQRL
jgi:hypothetical protein